MVYNVKPTQPCLVAPFFLVLDHQSGLWYACQPPHQWRELTVPKDWGDHPKHCRLRDQTGLSLEDMLLTLELLLGPATLNFAPDPGWLVWLWRGFFWQSRSNVPASPRQAPSIALLWSHCRHLHTLIWVYHLRWILPQLHLQWWEMFLSPHIPACAMPRWWGAMPEELLHEEGYMVLLPFRWTRSGAYHFYDKTWAVACTVIWIWPSEIMIWDTQATEMICISF